MSRAVHTVISFGASAIPRDQLSVIVADYWALDRARTFRRLLVTRFGLLALPILVVFPLIHRLSAFARWFTIGLFLVPPVWAWAAELRIERRLARRLDGVVTDKLVPPAGRAGDSIRKS